jgi:hypothetical protein
VTAAIRRSASLAVLVLGLVLGVGRAHAEPSSDDAKASARQVLIALRILAYDKTLAERHTGDAVTIVVVSSASQDGRAERAWWAAGFVLLPKVKVSGRPVRVVTLEFDTEAKFATAIAPHAPVAIFVTSELDAELEAIVRVARTRKAVTLARYERAMRAGIAVGLIAGQERDEILINIESTRASGARFGAGLLQLARLVDGRHSD